MVEQSHSTPSSTCKGYLNHPLGLDIIDPRSSHKIRVNKEKAQTNETIFIVFALSVTLSGISPRAC